MNWWGALVKSGLWKAAVYLLIITLLFGIVLLLSFSDGNVFDLEKLWNEEAQGYWTAYSVTIGLAIGSLVIGVMYNKDKYKAMPKIEDAKEEIYILNNTVISEGLAEDLSKHVNDIDRQRKIKKYIRYLSKMKAKAKKQTEIDKYEKLIAEASVVTFDVSKLNIRVKTITTNTLLGGIESRDEGDGLIYTGYEKIAEWVLPMLLFGMFLTAIFLAVAQPDKKELKLAEYLQLAATLYVMFSYLITGIRYADFSINVVYYNVLISRKNEYLKFFEKKGMKVVVKNNEYYKYRTEIVQGNAEAKNG